jgi:hypothetical protein
VIIKVLFAILVLSAAVLIAVAVAVFIRIRRHWKPQRVQTQNLTETTQQSSHEGELL